MAGVLVVFLLFQATACRNGLPSFTETDSDISIEPDYSAVTIPSNLAPLNFRINHTSGKYIARFYDNEGTDFLISSADGNIMIPQKKWKRLISTSGSKDIFIDILGKTESGWEKFNTITNHVVSDPVDRYLVYRLIEPGYETWNKMGIYQRDIETFGETPVMLNSVSGGNCMNCHSFSNNNSNTMMLHLRGENAGTIIYRDQKLVKINTKTDSTIAAGVYPNWHPSGGYIAYSVNNIVQSFHAVPSKKIEVYDTLSNIIVYDVNKNTVITSSLLSDAGKLETFPAWSPDGRSLYFCSAERRPMDQYNQIRYDLMRIAFDPEKSTFGKLDTILAVSGQGKSISFPRISPDGRYLMFCMADYGNFTIWHPETDLFLLELSTGTVSKPGINSDMTESFHNWSSSGRWIVFSSRRGDGLYTRPYFSYFDASGTAHKPFILPQKDPDFYFNFMKSYNLPELVTSAVELNPRKLEKIVVSQPVNASYKRME